MDRESWPEDGRVGRIGAGDYAGCYLLLTTEVDDSWAFYISDDPREVSADQIRADDFWAKDADAPLLVEAMAVEWADEADDVPLEKEIFDIRSEWHSRRRRRALLRSIFRRSGRRD
ncbi:hypothetical protein AB4225_36060 [Streptomyces sp. 2RAF24]|uniref:hypothetical protein n=1 Tax=unclassified Streptomyces TaxID=2593676 RepID=UPI0033DAE6B4